MVPKTFDLKNSVDNLSKIWYDRYTENSKNGIFAQPVYKIVGKPVDFSSEPSKHLPEQGGFF